MCSEHRIARGFAGFWTEQRKLIHSSSNEVPFKIVNGDTGVEIIDALSAEILGKNVIFSFIIMWHQSKLIIFILSRFGRHS